MRPRHGTPGRRGLLSTLALLLVAVGATVPVLAERPPLGRTYYTIAVGLEEAYGLNRECFEFHEDRLCSLGGLVCGSWQPTQDIRREMGLAFDLATVAGGDLLRLEGRARLDTHGGRSSFAGTGHLSAVEGDAPGVNFSFAAREIGKAACLDLLEDSPGDGDGSVVVGSGDVVTEERDVEAFDVLVASGVGLIEIRLGAAESLSITGDDNIVPLVTSEVIDGRLHLSSDGRFRTENNLRFQITTPHLDEMILVGVLGVDLSGVDADMLKVNVSGVSAVTVSGRVDTQELALAGVSRYDARSLASRSARVDITGPSSAVLRVSEQLRGSVLGGAVLEYIGSPTVDVTVDFVSTVKPLD